MTLGTLLQLEYSGTENDARNGVCRGQRLQLAYCDKHPSLCAVFCRDGGRCAQLLNSETTTKHHVSLGSNELCTSDFSHPTGKPFEACIPNALLREHAKRLGSPCAPPICEWTEERRCANSNDNLPPRMNDGTIAYESCCATIPHMHIPRARQYSVAIDRAFQAPPQAALAADSSSAPAVVTDSSPAPATAANTADDGPV